MSLWCAHRLRACILFLPLAVACADVSSAPDADLADAAPDPFAAEPTCTSNSFWTEGNRESPAMHPGDACITCHSLLDGPAFTVAGTVFASGHEPVDCNGGSAGGGPVTIEIKGADERVLVLTANSVGNFYSAQAVSFPITATIKYQDRERSMTLAQAEGDCNSCHTQTGSNGAPGRIALP